MDNMTTSPDQHSVSVMAERDKNEAAVGYILAQISRKTQNAVNLLARAKCPSNHTQSVTIY